MYLPFLSVTTASTSTKRDSFLITVPDAMTSPAGAGFCVLAGSGADAGFSCGFSCARICQEKPQSPSMALQTPIVRTAFLYPRNFPSIKPSCFDRPECQSIRDDHSAVFRGHLLTFRIAHYQTDQIGTSFHIKTHFHIDSRAPEPFQCAIEQFHLNDFFAARDKISVFVKNRRG